MSPLSGCGIIKSSRQMGKNAEVAGHEKQHDPKMGKTKEQGDAPRSPHPHGAAVAPHLYGDAPCPCLPGKIQG
ncbi:hypothetical protein GHF22_00535 [Enterococcus faecium]|nr:hypothetical protein [Enterococcus faecium]